MRFLASTGTFSNLDYSFKTLENRLRELAFLNSGVRIILRDERHAEQCSRSELHLRGRREANSSAISTVTSTPLIEEPIFISRRTRRHHRRSRDVVERRLSRDGVPFTNNIPQRDGGTHLAGFRGALTRTLNLYAGQVRASPRRRRSAFTGDDAREGLTCVLSVKVPDPKFSSQTKDKLVSSEVRPAVEGLMNEKLSEWFEEHPPRPAKMIVGKIIEAALAREAARKARETDPQEIRAST